MSIHFKYRKVLLFCLFAIITASQVYAADANGGYLNYQEPQPSATSSWLSTIAYVFSLVATFAVVIGLAYFTSRFLGQKMGQASVVGDNRILVTLALGPNRAVYIVEVAGKFLVLGVTENNITLLEEITDQIRIEKLKQQPAAMPASNQFDEIFQRQLASLQHMSQKFPTVFNNKDRSEQQDERER